jgi:glycosidase
LNFYKALIAFRKKSECLKYGKFLPLYADKCLMVYQRKLGDEVFTVALNFSSSKIKLKIKLKNKFPKETGNFLTGAALISNTNRSALDGALLPWEGILLKETTS